MSINQTMYLYSKKWRIAKQRQKIEVYLRHDAILQNKARAATEEFTIEYNKMYKVERRFGTMLRNHRMRRC